MGNHYLKAQPRLYVGTQIVSGFAYNLLHGLMNKTTFLLRQQYLLVKTITKYIQPSPPQYSFRSKAAFLRCRIAQQFSYLSSLFSNLFKSLGAGLGHLVTKCMCVHACVCVLPVKRREKTHRFEFVQCLPLFPAGMGFESQETKSMASTS